MVEALHEEVLALVEALEYRRELLRLRGENRRRADKRRRDDQWSIWGSPSPDLAWPQEDNKRICWVLAVLSDVGQINHRAQRLKRQGVRHNPLDIVESRDQNREAQPQGVGLSDLGNLGASHAA